MASSTNTSTFSLDSDVSERPSPSGDSSPRILSFKKIKSVNQDNLREVGGAKELGGGANGKRGGAYDLNKTKEEWKQGDNIKCGQTNNALEMGERCDNATEVINEELMRKLKEEEDKRKLEEMDGELEEKLLYTVDDNPPWYTCIVLGLQVRRIRVGIALRACLTH